MSKFLPDLIFVSMENWDDIWRRNQFLCASYAQRYPTAKILFVGLSRDVSNRLRRGKIADLTRYATRTVTGHPNITVTHPLKLLPNTLTGGRKVNEAMFRAHVRQAARSLGLRAPLLWLNPHSAVHMVGRMGARATVYDITDDWISLTQSAALTQLIRAQDGELCRRADAVIVCSQKLYELKRELARHLYLVPNGVDAAHYRSVQENGPRPADADWGRPVFGYTGSIHPDRVDVALIETLARAFPQGTIALVGPDMLPVPDRARLDALGNVRLTGAVPYARIPDYMRTLDVCITPHRMTPFTESLNPIKLWEYLAGGKPIVSTDVAGFRDYPQYVRLAATPDAFVTACVDALAENGALAKARMAEAGHHSWEKRLDQVMEVIAALPGH